MMKFVSVIIAVIALTSIASAEVVSIGNGMLFDVPYIMLIDNQDGYIDVNVAGMHIQGFGRDYFSDGSITFVGTVSYSNGTAINNQPGAGAAMGAVLALIGADFNNVKIGFNADGTINGVTPDASIKVGAYQSEDGFLLVAASNSNINGDHGATQVSYMVGAGKVYPAANEQSTRLSSF